MTGLAKMIHEQLLDYSEQLKVLEKEIVRKYKSGEDYSKDVSKASGLKMLKEECVRMMAQQIRIHNLTKPSQT